LLWGKQVVARGLRTAASGSSLQCAPVRGDKGDGEFWLPLL